MNTLVIKGTAVEAAAAAAKYGIRAGTHISAQNGVATLHVDDGQLDKIIPWFTELVPIIPSEGYPAGTLLYYS